MAFRARRGTPRAMSIVLLNALHDPGQRVHLKPADAEIVSTPRCALHNLAIRPGTAG